MSLKPQLSGPSCAINSGGGGGVGVGVRYGHDGVMMVRIGQFWRDRGRLGRFRYCNKGQEVSGWVSLGHFWFGWARLGLVGLVGVLGTPLKGYVDIF
jgi:hypothetical protein